MNLSCWLKLIQDTYIVLSVEVPVNWLRRPYYEAIVRKQSWPRSQAEAVFLHTELMLRGERYSGLTEREQQITKLVCDGLSNKAIAHQLGLSEGTVKLHLHHIYKKLGITTRSALLSLALSYRDRS